jgi:hypothetical protein
MMLSQRAAFEEFGCACAVKSAQVCRVLAGCCRKCGRDAPGSVSSEWQLLFTSELMLYMLMGILAVDQVSCC